MENSSQDLSSTANHSFSGDGDASEESGWTSYIDYFMETQRPQKEESGADPSTGDVGCRSASEYSGDCAGIGGSTRLPALVEPSKASGRLSLKKEGRRKKVLYDESLEDTATSPISSPKLIELRDSDANHQKKEDARDDIFHSKKTSVDKFGCNNHTNNGENTATDMDDDDAAYANNELRKKGLCLVPVSAFHV
ncbi:vascular-related unknown protein 1-like [Phragmites australis]|uniref:vascular-related unknown protein 1-like n=1 Tax=Phragmites australis TaxID=29695 RepID=UPI002D764AD6|nr:vascular-related unknown protein 1-like [Phragmites australis]XP_062191022.1 vascular-related unknown protein 1-like [Phragmites australis]